MIIQSPAIVLHIRPWSRTSHMVTWLTPEHGKIVTSVKGACRPKSAFLGQYDLFYTCDLLFYRREHDGIHAATAGYLADLTARAATGHHESPAIFDLLTRTLDLLAHAPAVDLRSLLLGYEIRLLHLLGYLPDLASCPVCHPAEKTWLRFSLASGRVLCPHLAKPSPGEATLALHRDVRSLFLQFAGTPETIPDNLLISPRPNLLLGLSRFLGMFITFHLEVPSAGRRVTWEMLDTNHAQTSA